MTLSRSSRAVLATVEAWPAMGDDVIAWLRNRETLRARELGGTGPEVHEIRDLVLPSGLAARVVRPSARTATGVLVWVHGGSWVSGSPETVDAQLRHLAVGSGLVVVAVDYRLAPEHRFPAAVEDVLEAIRWVNDGPAVLGAGRWTAIGGDSAGGAIAAGAAIRARDEGTARIDFQLLVYPALSRDADTASRRELAEGYWLTTDGLIWAWDQYLGRPEDARDPVACPLLVASVRGLPAAYLMFAEYDPLTGEGVEYAERLREGGVLAEVKVVPGMLHGFLACAGLVPEAAPAFAAIGEALRDAAAAHDRAPELAPQPHTPEEEDS